VPHFCSCHTLKHNMGGVVFLLKTNKAREGVILQAMSVSSV
jgi:hypothetical protein